MSVRFRTRMYGTGHMKRSVEQESPGGWIICRISDSIQYERKDSVSISGWKNPPSDCLVWRSSTCSCCLNQNSEPQRIPHVLPCPSFLHCIQIRPKPAWIYSDWIKYEHWNCVTIWWSGKSNVLYLIAALVQHRWDTGHVGLPLIY